MRNARSLDALGDVAQMNGHAAAHDIAHLAHRRAVGKPRTAGSPLGGLLVVLAGRSGQDAAFALDGLGLRARDRERPRDVGGDIAATAGHQIGPQRVTLREHGDGCRAGADVDGNDTQLALLPRRCGQASGERRGRQARGGKVGALDDLQQVLQRRILDRDGVQVRGELGAGHAARIGDATRLVEPVGDAIHVQQRALIALGVPAPRVQQPIDVPLADHALLDVAAGGERARFQAPARHAQVHFLQHHARHPLGLHHGAAYGLLRALEVGHRACREAARRLLADAQYLDTGRRR